MNTYDGFSQNRIKHLEMVQAVIARLSNSAFVVRGWAVTVVGLLSGFAINSSNWQLALVSAATTVAFWGLDTYFLRAERLFRELYDAIRDEQAEIEPFFMAATSRHFRDFLIKNSRHCPSWREAFLAPALAILYGILIVAAGFIIAIVGLHHQAPTTPRNR